ncbi:MAG: hypothetical protein KGL46_03815 [Hyphomicrobiales bacterium]|nr:hypothetical protein [Hyphomicrobiales bacterium]
MRVGYEAHETRGGSLDATIARAIALALNRCERKREQIAEDMSAELGRRVTKDMLDAWASLARTSNRIPLDAFAALVRASGQHELLGLIPEMFGFAVVPARYAEIIELHLIEDKKAELERRAAALAARVKGGR